MAPTQIHPEGGAEAERKHRAQSASAYVRCASRVPYCTRPALLLIVAGALAALDFLNEPWWPPWSEDWHIEPLGERCVDPAAGGAVVAGLATRSACLADGACSRSGFSGRYACELGVCVATAVTEEVCRSVGSGRRRRLQDASTCASLGSGFAAACSGSDSCVPLAECPGEPEPELQAEPTVVALSLSGELADIAEPAAYDTFVASFKADLATALGLADTARIVIHRVLAGSIVVQFYLTEAASGASVAALLTTLATKSSDGSLATAMPSFVSGSYDAAPTDEDPLTWITGLGCVDQWRQLPSECALVAGRSWLDGTWTSSGYSWASAEVSTQWDEMLHRHTGLSDAGWQGEFYYSSTGWERARFNLRNFHVFWSPARPCGLEWGDHFTAENGFLGGLDALLTCDGNTLGTNLLAHLAMGALVPLVGIPMMWPYWKVGWVYVAVLGEMLNIWHQFVASGRYEDPSWIDLWLFTLGLLLGGGLGRGMGYCCACFFCSRCPRFDLTPDDLNYASRRKKHKAKVAAGTVVPHHVESRHLEEWELQELRLRRLFNMADKDRSGYLDKEELATITRKLLPIEKGMTDAAIERMVLEADKNGDGRISSDEFIAIVVSGIEQQEKRMAAKVGNRPVDADGNDPDESVIYDHIANLLDAMGDEEDDSDAKKPGLGSGDEVARPVAPVPPPPFLVAATARLAALGAERTEGIFRAEPEDLEFVERAWMHLAGVGAAKPEEALEQIDDVHSVAALLKRWFRELSDAVITAECYTAHHRLLEHAHEDTVAEAVIIAVDTLSAPSQSALREIVRYLQTVDEDHTGMDPTKLATEFAPLLLQLTEGEGSEPEDPETFKEHVKFMRVLLDHLAYQPWRPKTESELAAEKEVAEAKVTMQSATGLLELFHRYDTDGSGSLELPDMDKCLRAFLVRSTKVEEAQIEEEVASIMKAADQDNDGRVDYLEFSRMFPLLVNGEFEPEPADAEPEPEPELELESEPKEPIGGAHLPTDGTGRDVLAQGPVLPPTMQFMPLFRKFDRARQGFIGPKELQRGWHRYMKQRLSSKQARQMFESADANKDGKIDYVEFVAIIEKGMAAVPTRDPADAASSASASSFAPSARSLIKEDGAQDVLMHAPEESPVRPGSPSKHSRTPRASPAQAAPPPPPSLEPESGSLQTQVLNLARQVNMLTKSLELDAGTMEIPKPSGKHSNPPHSPPGMNLELGIAAPATLPPLRGGPGMEQQRGLGGALLALRDQQKTETTAMTMLKDLIEVSLINMEQRIESRIDGIEQTLFDDAHPEFGSEEEDEELGNDITEVDPEVLQKIAKMEAALTRYRAYLNPRDPTIVSLLQQLAQTCDQAELWGDARSWRKKAEKAEKASRPEEEEDADDGERTASFFADGPMLQNMMQQQQQASP